MRFLKNLKLTNKMLISPLVVVVFFVLLAFGTFNGLSLMKDSINDIFKNRFKGYQGSSKIMSDAANVHANLYKILNWVSTQHDAKQVEILSKEQATAITGDIDFIKKTLAGSNLAGEERKLYEAVLANLLEYQKPAVGVIDIAAADVNAAIMFMSTADEKFLILNKSLADLNQLEIKLGEQKFDASMKSYDSTIVIFVATFVVSILIAFVVSIWITRMIIRPIREIIANLKRVAEGDLACRLNMEMKDEIGELVQSVNTMRMKMGDAVGQALQVSRVLADAATEQAASIEESSASLDEIASMTKQNAGNTAEANQLMISVKDSIQKANESMVELTTSMKEITGASEQTQKIVKSIDEIAFQTNLLALNAAVEAARAGEAGAGFAVVADEVRNLAMRATESAKNSSNLIGDIVVKVKGGQSLVDATSTAFNQVSASSEKVVALMGEISVASREQSEGVDQINTTIAGMSSTTQLNAGNAEKLSSIMSIFKTEAYDQAVAALPAPDGTHSDWDR